MLLFSRKRRTTFVADTYGDSRRHGPHGRRQILMSKA
jgi:hypothetical protein